MCEFKNKVNCEFEHKLIYDWITKFDDDANF